MDMFPLRVTLLVEMDTPPIPDELFTIWQSLAEVSDSNKGISTSLLQESLPRVELQITGQEGMPARGSMPRMRAFSGTTDNPGFICLWPIELDRVPLFTEFKVKHEAKQYLSPYGTHMHASFKPGKPGGSLRRIAVRIDGLLELQGEAEGGSHPEIRYRVMIAPTKRLPTPEQSLLGQPPA